MTVLLRLHLHSMHIFCGEAILDAFEHSGMSGQAFARQIGVKYLAFASRQENFDGISHDAYTLFTVSTVLHDKMST